MKDYDLTFARYEVLAWLATDPESSITLSWISEVSALRTIRDAFLQKSVIGRELIRTYYAYGPALANAIAPSPLLRASTRALLDPIAKLKLGAHPQ